MPSTVPENAGIFFNSPNIGIAECSTSETMTGALLTPAHAALLLTPNSAGQGLRVYSISVFVASFLTPWITKTYMPPVGVLAIWILRGSNYYIRDRISYGGDKPDSFTKNYPEDVDDFLVLPTDAIYLSNFGLMPGPDAGNSAWVSGAAWPVTATANAADALPTSGSI